MSEDYAQLKASQTAESLYGEAVQRILEAEANIATHTTSIANNSSQIGNLSASVTANTASISNMAQSSLAKLVQDMVNGFSVTIDCHGDSTYYGYLSGVGTQVATPAPLQLQTVLRTHFGNNNITVINNGISGNTTTNALRTFDSDMASSSASIVYLNYGLNDMSGANPTGASDPAISAEQYRQNIRQLVALARNHGKIVVLDTANVELANHAGTDFQFRMEGSQQFSDAMRQVAREMHVPLVDNQYLTRKYMQSALYIPTVFPDGLHPNQALYIQKGQNMAMPLIAPSMVAVKAPCIIPAGLPGMQGTGTGVNMSANTNTRTGLFFYGQNSVRTAIWIDEPGLDVYVATAVWSAGTDQCQINVDGSTVKTISLLESTLASPTFGADQEILVIQNATPGLHFIELKNNNVNNNYVGMYYIRTHKTRYKFGSAFSPTGSAPTYTQRDTVLQDFDITLPSGAVGGNLMTDIPVSRTLNTVDVEMTANLSNGDGIMLFAHTISNDGTPHGGLYLFLDGTTGNLSISEGSGATSYTTVIVINTTVYAGTSHKYRMTVTPAGAVTIYVDGTQVGTYTMTKNYFGGFLGFYKKNAGATRIDRVTLYS